MKNTSGSHFDFVTAIAGVVGLYFAGYAVIRFQCTGSSPDLVVPNNTALITIYKPLFYTERYLTGHHFSISPYGLDVGF